ncbi:DUF2059 domain-containing protein [Brevundimonas sp.]|uniref:DUF2059 domain-containing protein n=1 Tax=Brevundimonas sp. TaxID=1871086 RepID=UPI002D6F6CEB|nr:DUF2059 domain-containing protein [Brevundimonas sp.]HYC96320.1 DUF2059 domain-containing protein [Brevundimonas sp.]
MRFWMIVVAGLTLASGAAAQSKPPQPPAAAVEGQPSARQLELTRRYVDLMMSDQFETMIRQMIDMEASMDPEARGMPEEDRRFMTDLASELVTDMIPQMLDEMVPVYARTFSEAELEALIAFYDSEMGRSIINKTYASMPDATAAAMTVMPQMLEKMASRMCQHYGCTADELRNMREEMQGAFAEPTARSK